MATMAVNDQESSYERSITHQSMVSRHTYSQEQLIEEFRRPPTICCRSLRADKSYRNMALSMFVLDIILVGFAWFFMITFLFIEDGSHFSQSFIAKSTLDDRNSIEIHYILILLPQIILLHLTTIFGVRWIRKDFSRPAYQSFYSLSIALYFSFFI